MSISTGGIAFKTSKKEFPFFEISKITGDTYVQVDSFNEISFPGHANYFTIEYFENSVWIYGDCFNQIVFGKNERSQKELFKLIGNPSRVIGFQEYDSSNFSAFNLFENGIKTRQRVTSLINEKIEFQGEPLSIEVEIENSPKRRVEWDIGYYVQEYSYNFESVDFKISEDFLTHYICYFLLKKEFGFCLWHEGKMTKPLKKEIYVLKSEYDRSIQRRKKSKPEFEFRIPFLDRLNSKWNKFWSTTFPAKVAFLKIKKLDAKKLRKAFLVNNYIMKTVSFLMLLFLLSWIRWLIQKPSFSYFLFQSVLVVLLIFFALLSIMIEFVFSFSEFNIEKLKNYKSFLELKDVQRIIDSTSIADQLQPKSVEKNILYAIDYRYVLSKISIYDFNKLNEFFNYIDSLILEKFNFKIKVNFELNREKKVITNRRIRFNEGETTLHPNLNSVISEINSQLKNERIDFAFYEFESHYGYDYIGLNQKDFKILNELKKHFNKESGLYPFKLRSK